MARNGLIVPHSLSHHSMCDPDRIRTCDLLIRSQLLYPAELRGQFFNLEPQKYKNTQQFCTFSADKLFTDMPDNSTRVKIEPSWATVLGDEFQKPYFTKLVEFLRKERDQRKKIYPKGSLIFNAFNSTPFDQVKVVSLGQDPYHGAGQAMGLSFSVPGDIRIPPSLRNIYNEIHRSCSFRIPAHGDLSAWASQGVFLLNAVLTVEAGRPRSHAKAGWEHFTDAVIQKLSEERQGLVFLLWGNFARQKRSLIDENRHLILESAHPSPLAGNRFQGNNHFYDTNEYLVKSGQIPINWQL